MNINVLFFWPEFSAKMFANRLCIVPKNQYASILLIYLFCVNFVKTEKFIHKIITKSHIREVYVSYSAQKLKKKKHTKDDDSAAEHTSKFSTKIHKFKFS